MVKENLAIPDFERINPTRLTIQLSEMYWFYQDLVKNPDLGKKVGKDVMSFFEHGSKIGMLEQMLASRRRLTIIEGLSRVLKDVDFIAMPTCLTTAPKIEEVSGHEAGSIRRQLVRNTELFNLTGLPSLSIPTNDLNSSELPTAMQISGRPLEDNDLLEVGERIWKSIHE